MEYEESYRSGYQERENIDWAEDVHIREEDRGIVIYAVFDGEEQISEEYAPAQDHTCIEFASAYSQGMRNADSALAASYEEREEMSMESIVVECIAALEIGFEHVEYMLGNADFEEAEINFEKLESAYNALSEIIQFIDGEEFESLERR